MCRFPGRRNIECADFVAGAALCVPPFRLEVHLFLEVKISCRCSRQVQHFVNLHVQISWQAQHFVHLHVQISWQAQYRMRCGEIANARNAVFFNGTGGSEAGKSRSAERRLRDGLGSFSDHARIMLGIVRPLGLEVSLVS